MALYPLEYEPRTTLTDIHVRLIDILKSIGLSVETEVSFPPKSVDCYLPDYHIAFEADGPQHSMQKDLDRDAFLLTEYALPVFHVDYRILESDDNVEIYKKLIAVILDNDWKSTRTQRRMIAWKAGALESG